MTETVYTVKVETSAEPTRYLRATFRATSEDITKQHPIDIFGEVFKETIAAAAKALEDPSVREVPIYQAGVFEPVAYLTRF